jgi:predicted adenine nucleotide alpha hydrolase (AANH) superfamily ATPase
MHVAQSTLLLHVCCGPCATHVIDVLRDKYAVTLFFSNSNIAPFGEYQKRLRAVEKLAVLAGCDLVSDVYDHEAWLAGVRGLAHEPEQGARCVKCFEFNLHRAAQYAARHDFACFTTTLTVSPHKDTATIFAVGRAAGPFLETDFKKSGGFRRSVTLSEEFGLYRQTYCGCEFSEHT